MSLSVSGIKELQRALKSYGADVTRIQTRALNRTITKGRTMASKEIREEVRLTAGYVGKHLKVIKASFARQVASVVAKKRGILLSRFPHTVKKGKGVVIRIKKGGSAKMLMRAFKTTVSAGGTPVDVIATRTGGRYKNGNAKFRTFYGASPSQVLNNTKGKLSPILERELRSQLEKELAQAAKRAKR